MCHMPVSAYQQAVHPPYFALRNVPYRPMFTDCHGRVVICQSALLYHVRAFLRREQ